MRRITVSDYTLRESEKNGTNRLLFREKLALAVGIDRYGADVIELPAVKNPKEDLIVFKTISQSVRNAVVAIPAGNSADEVKVASDCVKSAAKSRLIVSLPVSTVQMEYMYRLKAPKMLEMIRSLVSQARALCEDVEFEALDATRSDIDFLVQACVAAKESGATCICISDDAGIMLPEEFAATAKRIEKETKLPLTVKVSDSISLAVADALAAIRSGASGVKVALSAKGALTVDAFAEAMRVRGDSLEITTGLKLTEIHTDIESLLKKMQGGTRKEDDPLVSGAAVFLDADSTIQQVSDAVRSLGYDLSREDVGKVHEALLRLCEKKSSIGGKELEAIIASTAMQVPATYTLVSYIGTMSNKVNSVTNVILEREGEKLSGTGTGNGPIDSAFMAIEQCIGHHYELDDFQIQSVTEGKESLGAALVRLRSNGKLFSGNGLSSDICGASLRAYINALNKIAYEESQR